MGIVMKTNNFSGVTILPDTDGHVIMFKFDDGSIWLSEPINTSKSKSKVASAMITLGEDIIRSRARAECEDERLTVNPGRDSIIRKLRGYVEQTFNKFEDSRSSTSADDLFGYQCEDAEVRDMLDMAQTIETSMGMLLDTFRIIILREQQAREQAEAKVESERARAGRLKKHMDGYLSLIHI